MTDIDYDVRPDFCADENMDKPMPDPALWENIGFVKQDRSRDSKKPIFYPAFKHQESGFICVAISADQWCVGKDKKQVNKRLSNILNRLNA